MQTRAGRMVLLTVLVVAAAAALLVIRTLHARLDALSTSGGAVAARIAVLEGAVADIAAAQASYVAPGQSVPQAAARVASLVQTIADDTAVIRPSLRSVDAANKLQALSDTAAAVVRADQGARDRIKAGDAPAAATLIFGNARPLLATMRTTMTSLAQDEATAFTAEEAGVDQQIWTVVGALGAVWVLGLLVLARVPGPQASAQAAIPVPQAPAADAIVEMPSAPFVDLAAAADLCTAISRLTSGAALPDTLARAATVLDASGVILWMGAGEELFAAASHGYDPRVISRLGPIHRSADNATAAAWRTGELRTVAGDMMSNGAVVAPMFQSDQCIGVLAAEIRHGREDDMSTRAVTSMIAAQLATAVSPWPAAALPVADRSVSSQH